LQLQSNRVSAVATGVCRAPPTRPRFKEDDLAQTVVKQEAYVYGKAYIENLVPMGPLVPSAGRPSYIEIETAKDFYRMSFAALQAGVLLTFDTLDVLKGFRTFDEQARLRRQRHHPNGDKNAVGLVKGPAAIAGFGNHQQGRAMDLAVGISYPAFAGGRGKINKVYAWLVENAGTFGFAQADVYGIAKSGEESISEAWHWVHVEKTAIGPVPTDEQLVAYEEFLYANRTNTLFKSGILPKDVSDGRSLRLYQAAPDTTRRALDIAKASRAKLRDLAGAAAVYGVARSSRYAAGNNPAGRTDSSRGMAPAVSDFWMYDFNTGQYGGSYTPEEDVGD
jgi:LAS superfamily LD-carboxypeptidase LdcB